RVVPVALPGPYRPVFGQPTPTIRVPGGAETAIELPWWLILSPHAEAAWAHSDHVVTHDGWTELWHTRLGVRMSTVGTHLVNESDASLRTVRAVWAQD